MRSSLENCPVPTEQQPLNEYEELKNAWLFRDSILSWANFTKKIFWIWAWSWLVAGPVAAASGGATRGGADCRHGRGGLPRTDCARATLPGGGGRGVPRRRGGPGDRPDAVGGHGNRTRSERERRRRRRAGHGGRHRHSGRARGEPRARMAAAAERR